VKITLISDKPDHPVLAAMVDRLRACHRVAVISAESDDPATLAALLYASGWYAATPRPIASTTERRN